MFKIDKKYDEHVITNDSAYPGGKAKDATTEEGINGTKWAADWFNTILGFFTALIVEAEGSFKVSGTPDKVGNSDLLNSVKKIITKMVSPDITSILASIVDLQGPNDNHLYGRKNKKWSEVIIPPAAGIGDALAVLKLFSNSTLTLTNATTVDRRIKRWDIGLPFISPASEVYHFDTDMKNQYQGTSIAIGYTTAPSYVSASNSSDQVYYNPAVLDTLPHEPLGRSLLGRFSVTTKIPNTDSTFEFWLRLKTVSNMCVFRLKTEKGENLSFILGGASPAYSVAASGSIPYSTAAENSIPYEISGTTQNRLEHYSYKGSETINLAGVDISPNSWLHIAAVVTAAKLAFFIGQSKFEVNKHFLDIQNSDIVLNEDRAEINLDELTIDRTTAILADDFNTNTANHIPYGGLDYKQKWSVIMFDNPNRVATNLFESEQFKMAVLSAIHNSR
jgi:hypothetical protein